MPELPEVEVTTRGLKAKVLGRTFVDVWADFEKIVKKPSFKDFKEKIKGKKIEKARRKGKNIIMDLSEGYSLLVHQKMTGHLLYGKWKEKNGKWEAEEPGFLKDKDNQYIHLMFFLDNKKMLALSDLRKFAKVELWKTKDLENSELFDRLGPDPLKISFERFKKELKKGKIKKVLMDQEVLAGLGNIYSDEALWRAGIHPLREATKLKGSELKKLYLAVREVLKKGIILGGESISDYRNIEGGKGFFDKERKVYRREGEKCPHCGTKIKRIKVNGRSAHFCPKCQRPDKL
jgi:formamidopyrimidine-DNA glycosylase